MWRMLKVAEEVAVNSSRCAFKARVVFHLRVCVGDAWVGCEHA